MGMRVTENVPGRTGNCGGSTALFFFFFAWGLNLEQVPGRGMTGVDRTFLFFFAV